MMKPQNTNMITASIKVGDVEKSLDFYTKTLGFRTFEKFTRPDGKIAHASVGFDSPLLAISTIRSGRSPKTREETSPNNLGVVVELHICVDGWKKFNEFFAEQKAKGTTAIDEPKTDLRGDKSFTVLDPDGYALSFGGRAERVTSQQRSFDRKRHPVRPTQRKSYDSIFSTR